MPVEWWPASAQPQSCSNACCTRYWRGSQVLRLQSMTCWSEKETSRKASVDSTDSQETDKSKQRGRDPCKAILDHYASSYRPVALNLSVPWARWLAWGWSMGWILHCLNWAPCHTVPHTWPCNLPSRLSHRSRHLAARGATTVPPQPNLDQWEALQARWQLHGLDLTNGPGFEHTCYRL